MNSSYKTIVFDFDSTIVAVESLEFLAETALEGTTTKVEILEKMRSITDRGMSGELSIAKSLSERFELIRAHRKHIAPTAEKLVAYISKSFLNRPDFFSNSKFDVHVVSSGFFDLIYPSTDTLGIPRAHVHANTFAYDAESNILGPTDDSVLARPMGKVQVIRTLGLMLPLAMVGDGFTDFEVKKYGAAQSFIYYAEHVKREGVSKEGDVLAYNLDDILSYLDAH